MGESFGEPESRSLTVRGLIKNLRSGWMLRLPSFQRSFVWDDEDVKRFIDSIIKGYPTGTILLWKPSKPDIDPFSLDFLNDSSLKSTAFSHFKEGETYYVIDGQQRLTALMLLVNGWNIFRGRKKIKTSTITVNPSKEPPELYIDPKQKKGVDLHRGVRDRLFTDISESDKLRKELGVDAYNRFMRLIDKILDYNIPLYIINTSQETVGIIGVMANIFIMVNRAGQRITNMELLLSYTAGIFDQELAQKIRTFYDEIQQTFSEEVSITSYLRFAFSTPVLGLTQQEINNVEKFKAAVKKLKGQLTVDGKNVFYERATIAGRAYKLALNLVKEIFGYAALDLIPSHLSLIPLSCYLYKERMEGLESLSEKDLSLIKKWLLLVNFNGYYSTRPSSRLQKDIETVHASSGESFPYNELLENIKKGRKSATEITSESIEEGRYRDILKRPSSAHLFLLYILLADNKAENWKGKLIKLCNLSDLAKAHIFPRDMMKTSFLSSELYDEDERNLISKGINGLGNITFMDKEENSILSDKLPEHYLPDYSKELIKQHFIPSQEYWSIDRFEEFTEQRTKLIIDFMKGHYSDIFKD
ncbi:MAG: DUF262 domain-containing protein [Candidatus Caldarchaeum sp.]|jgi:uncharacterized protein with ParB-like and HNH nuclease domain